MSRMIPCRVVAPNASFGLLTVAFVLACICPPQITQAKGWDELPEILARIVPPTFPDDDFVIMD